MKRLRFLWSCGWICFLHLMLMKCMGDAFTYHTTRVSNSVRAIRHHLPTFLMFCFMLFHSPQSHYI
jgi:hypothetical protein